MGNDEIVAAAAGILGPAWGVEGNDDIGYLFGNGEYSCVVPPEHVSSHTPEEVAIYVTANKVPM